MIAAGAPPRGTELLYSVDVATPGQPYKVCPNCKQHAPLDADVCTRCGHQYRTQFADPDQTQAFGAAPGGPRPAPGPVPGPYDAPPSPYPRSAPTGPPRGRLPTWAAFLIGFLIPIAGVILGVLLYTLESMRDPEAAKWCFIRAVAGFAIPFCFCSMFSLAPMLFSL